MSVLILWRFTENHVINLLHGQETCKSATVYTSDIIGKPMTESVKDFAIKLLRVWRSATKVFWQESSSQYRFNRNILREINEGRCICVIHCGP
jgi:hypothetical protein